jgi:long-chain acyl-CoA synthetase
MSPSEGERLKAFVVPADPLQSSTELRQQLQVWCQQNLKTAERPQAFTFGSQLPCNALGKNSDWPLQSSG